MNIDAIPLLQLSGLHHADANIQDNKGTEFTHQLNMKLFRQPLAVTTTKFDNSANHCVGPVYCCS